MTAPNDAPAPEKTVVVVEPEHYEFVELIPPGPRSHWWIVERHHYASERVGRLLDEIVRLRALEAENARLRELGGELLRRAWEFNPDIANRGFQLFGPYLLGMTDDGDLAAWRRPVDEDTPAVAMLDDYDDAFAWIAEHFDSDAPPTEETR